mgnify:CR=1 FL=1
MSHQCLSAFWVSRTGGREPGINRQPRHQCLSAFWVSRTSSEFKEARKMLFLVTNACRRFGSVGPRAAILKERQCRGLSPMPVGVLGQSDQEIDAAIDNPLSTWVTNACRRFGSVGPALTDDEVLDMEDQSPMPVGVLGQSDPAFRVSDIRPISTVTNACRRFGSVGPRGARGGISAGQGWSPMPVGVLGQSDVHFCTREEAERIRSSPMPVGVLGQSDSTTT